MEHWWWLLRASSIIGSFSFDFTFTFCFYSIYLLSNKYWFVWPYTFNGLFREWFHGNPPLFYVLAHYLKPFYWLVGVVSRIFMGPFSSPGTLWWVIDDVNVCYVWPDNGKRAPKHFYLFFIYLFLCACVWLVCVCAFSMAPLLLKLLKPFHFSFRNLFRVNCTLEVNGVSGINSTLGGAKSACVWTWIVPR